MKRNYLFALGISCFTLFAACDKDDTEPTTPKPGTMEVMFEHKVGDNALALNSTTYTTHHGEDFTVKTFKYYISNVVLTTTDGSTYAEPESYHLVDESDASSKMFNITDVPAGDYKSVTFMIGVDSARNVSGAQTGALDPIHGMFWSWNNGYIMAKFEGTSPQSTGTDGYVEYHVGGFKGENSVLRTVTLNFDEVMKVDNNTVHQHINVNLAHWFHGDNHILFADVYDVHMPGETARKMADNYQHMFSLGADGH